MKTDEKIKGYKIFSPKWTYGGIRYTCPGTFKVGVEPLTEFRRIHFYKKAEDCFKYYRISSKIKVAQVIAYGETDKDIGMCCTDKLEIVREMSWQELFEIAQIEREDTGIFNSGKENSGYYNSGNHNNGNFNSGNENSGDYNTGGSNRGRGNSGNNNTGHHNCGCYNSGDYNSGDYNEGGFNSGDFNKGNFNSGSYNKGRHNCGFGNSGNLNSGCHNKGNCNTGDWNRCNYSTGCFNTITPTILLFNKPSTWTLEDWQNSKACDILNQAPYDELLYVEYEDMTDSEKFTHPEARITGGYLKEVDNSEGRSAWWHFLPDEDKEVVKSIPNFDPELFKEITGIDVNATVTDDTEHTSDF